MVGFQTGGDKSQIDAAGLEHQDGTKVMLCFLRSWMIQQGAFETVVLFFRPQRLLQKVSVDSQRDSLEDFVRD